MKPINLYRRRFIPDEIIHLKHDICLVHEKNLIITKWNKLHPREDISGGVSAFYLDQGIKVSKIYDNQGHVIYWYCDIIQIKKEPDRNAIIYEDLLLDVILYPDGSVRVCDLDELADAMELNLITPEETRKALRTLDHLLNIIYQDRFSSLQAPINEAEQLYSSSSI